MGGALLAAGVALAPLAGRGRAQTIEVPNADPILTTGDPQEDAWRRSAPTYLRADDDPYPWIDWAQRDPERGKFQSVWPSRTRAELKRLGGAADAFIDHAESAHFHLVIGRDGPLARDWTEQRRLEHLNALEYYYHVACHRLGLLLSTQSWRAEDRRDELRYRINIIASNTGVPGALSSGTAVSTTDDQLGLNGVVIVGVAREPLPFVLAHELGHGARFDIDRPLFKDADRDRRRVARVGFLSESFANWFAMRLTGSVRVSGPPESFQRHAHKEPNSKWQNYHAWYLYEHLRTAPGLGYEAIWELYRGQHIPADAAARDETGWERARRIIPDFDDELGRMAARIATLDFERGDRMREQARYTSRESRRVLPTYPIERLDQPGWYDVPPWKAPSQLGINLIPLEPLAGATEVAVDFVGPVDPLRGSAWRVGLVATDDTYSTARYGEIWREGRGRLPLEEGDSLLFLSVIAVPEEVDGSYGRIDDVPQSEFRSSPATATFPYRVRLEGARIRDLAAADGGRSEANAPSARRHPNGGGWVSSGASVHPDAFVGPDARVRGSAIVEEGARIEGRARVDDHAWVEAGAIVRDDAWIRDYAWLRRDSVAEGESRVEDFGRLDRGARIGGRARLREMGLFAGDQPLRGHALLEGLARQRNLMEGNALADGSSLGCNEPLDRGVRLSFLEAGQALTDTGGLYLDYQFDEGHPHLALDSHGVNHGLFDQAPELVARPGQGGTALKLDGLDDCLRLPHGSVDFIDLNLALDVWPARDVAMPLLTCLGEAQGQPTELSVTTDLVVTVRIGDAVESFAAERGLPARTWSRLELEFRGDRAVVSVDGVEVAQGAVAANPETLGASTNLIGKDAEDDFFEGQIDDLRIYRTARADSAPPVPNPAEWDAMRMPSATGSGSISMRAGPTMDYGADARVEYQFEVRRGDRVESLSAWRPEATFKLVGLEPNELYEARFRARDRSGNTGAWSASLPVMTMESEPAAIVQPEEPNRDGFIFEAEDFGRMLPGRSGSEWISIGEAPWWSDREISGRALVATAGAADPQRPFAELEDGAMLEYYIRFVRTGRYRLSVHGGGETAKNNSLRGTLDREPLRTLEHIKVREGRLTWMARSMETLSDVVFDVPVTGPYLLRLYAREAGTIVDRVQVVPAVERKRAPDRALESVRPSAPATEAVGPSAVSGLRLEGGFRLRWERGSEDNVAGHCLVGVERDSNRWQVVDRSLPGRLTSAVVPDGRWARLGVAAVDREGNVGPFRVIDR